MRWRRAASRANRDTDVFGGASFSLGATSTAITNCVMALTFGLSTISGFLLGANQPLPGPGMAITGWHWHQDLRPSHFLAVHAQQLIPVLGLLAVHWFGRFALMGLVIGSSLYWLVWLYLTWLGLQ